MIVSQKIIGPGVGFIQAPVPGGDEIFQFCQFLSILGPPIHLLPDAESVFEYFTPPVDPAAAARTQAHRFGAFCFWAEIVHLEEGTIVTMSAIEENSLCQPFHEGENIIRNMSFFQEPREGLHESVPRCVTNEEELVEKPCEPEIERQNRLLLCAAKDRFPLEGQLLTAIEQIVGDTPLIQLQRQETGSNRILVKLEGNNPAGSVKDRPAYSMIVLSEKKGRIKVGDTLIEATSGNTGIALAMVAAVRGYRMVLVMPENASLERRATMTAYGAELVLTPASEGMEGARDTAVRMETEGRGVILDQFANPDNPLSHYESTGPEIWRDTNGEITHFVSSMGTTGTIMGVGQYLKEQNPDVQIVGVQPAEGAKIPGIRKWPEEYQPKFYRPEKIDRFITVGQEEAEETARRMTRQEGLFCGVSSGGNIAAALRLAGEVEEALIVAIVCDRGDRYVSTGIFDRSG